MLLKLGCLVYVLFVSNIVVEIVLLNENLLREKGYCKLLVIC